MSARRLLGFFAASLFVTAPTQAAEYGFSDYLLGLSVILRKVRNEHMFSAMPL